MTKNGAQRLRKMALVMAGVTLAAMSFGATEPMYPDVGRGDQVADISHCATETIDSVTVCARDEHAGLDLTVTTVAAGLTIVD